MTDVFILGAGFSKAINHLMPELTELSIKVKEKCEKRGSKLPPPCIDIDNIELWLTYLSQPQPWLKEYYNLENRALFLRMTEIIGEVLNESARETITNDCPEWLASLIQYWYKDKSNVITLNYDTLIERASLVLGIKTQSIYPIRLTDVRRISTVGTKPESSFRLFKLHGSINWYYSGAASFHGEVLYFGPVSAWGDVSYSIESEAISAAADKVPLIIPPTSEKTTYFQHETLRQIWLKASAALSAATCVYCVGYSLPKTDLGIRFFLQHGRPNEKVPLVVVNKKDEVIKRYKDLLGDYYDIDTKYATTGIEGFMKDLV